MTGDNTDAADRTAYLIVDRRTGRKPSPPWSDFWDVFTEYRPSVEDDPFHEQHAISWSVEGDDDQDDEPPAPITDGGTHVRHRRFHVREQSNDTDFPSGVGVEFPSGTVVVEWVPEAWPPEERLDGAHQSTYDTIDDLRQVVSGEIYYVDANDRVVTDGGVAVDAGSAPDTRVWSDAMIETDRYGEPTGEMFVECLSCGVEVLEQFREAATHRDGCPHGGELR